MTLAVQKNPGDSSGFFFDSWAAMGRLLRDPWTKKPKNGAYILHCGIELQKMKYWSER
jgi:hypothetical protein